MTDTQTPETPEAKPRRLRFWLLIALALLILLPVILIGALLLVLRSEAGTAWVIDQVPGLEVTQGQGSLLSQWRAESLAWQGSGTSVQVESPSFSWSPSCLFDLEFCLDNLEAQSVDVTLPPSEPDSEPATTIELPQVDLPFTVTISSVNIGRFTLGEQTVWDRFRLSAKGSGADWSVLTLSLQREALSLDVSGRVQTRREWPLDLAVQAALPPPEGDQWLLNLNLTGSVEDLLIRGGSQGYLNASLSGGTEPLKPALPVRLRVQTPKFRASSDLPETLTLLDTGISVEGSLAEGFDVDGKGQLPGTQGNISLALKGRVKTTGVEKLDLRLTGQGTGDAQTGTASVNGNLSWEEALSADARIAVDAFPWFHLLPDVEPPPVVLKRLNGDVTYQDGQYTASLEAVIDGPQGPADLASEIDGDLESLSLTSLSVNTDAGSLSGQGQVGFAGPVTWQTTLQLNQFNPGYWVPALKASLDGEVTSEGKLPPEGPPSIQATWNLDGSWRASEAEIRGNLNQSGDTLRLSDLELRVDENRISGQGQWGPELSGNLQISLPSPQLFLPELEGTLNGTASVGGTPDAPRGEVSLTAQGLAYADQGEIKKLELSASLSEGQSVSGNLVANGLSGAGQALEQLTLDLSGTQQDHRLRINGKHQEAEVVFAFAGGAGADWSSWAGQLTKGEIDVTSQNQLWRLNQPADLAYSKAGRLTFGEHCWLWQEASVCAGQQTLLPQPVVDYRIRNFPTTALAPLMPKTLKWETLLDADVAFTTTDAGSEGSVTVDAGDGEFSVRNADEWEAFKYNELTSKVELLANQANLQVSLDGPRLGELSANVSVDPQSEEKNLDGEFRIAELDISMAAVFAGLETIKGQLNGQGTISGPLMKPAVNGDIALTGGEVSDPSLPLPLKDLVANVTLTGYQADVSGRWKSSEESSGAIDGSVRWENEPEVALQLTGSRLPVHYDPYASVELEPDLKIEYSAAGLSVSGRLAVPRGKIEVTQLPEQAVSVSEDEVIVGADVEEPAPFQLNMNVTVVVGEDKVTFNGFEVMGNLEGTLRISDNLDTRGSLRLIDGRYEAYGQDLELRRARLLFTGPLSQPYLDIEAIRRVDSVIAGIRLSGPVTAPRTEVFSEPGMPQSDALHYLVLGKSPDAKSEGGDGQVRNAAISMGLNQAADITRGVGEELGIRELTLEAEGSGDDAAVVASGYLTEDLSVRYGVGIFEPISTVALRYDLGKYFYLEAASGLASSLDIFYTRDF